MKIIKKIVIWLLLIVALCLTSMPLWPLYYKWFVPYPKLEEATVYHGILSVEGKMSLSKIMCNTSLKYYVTDEVGKHEIYYGLPGCREAPYKYPTEHLADGTYWFHSTFGVIQSDQLHPTSRSFGKETERFFLSYEIEKKLFEQQFDYKNTFIRAIPFLWLLIYLVRSRP
jgi:hypothetical protein